MLAFSLILVTFIPTLSIGVGFYIMTQTVQPARRYFFCGWRLVTKKEIACLVSHYDQNTMSGTQKIVQTIFGATDGVRQNGSRPVMFLALTSILTIARSTSTTGILTMRMATCVSVPKFLVKGSLGSFFALHELK